MARRARPQFPALLFGYRYLPLTVGELARFPDIPTALAVVFRQIGEER